MSSTSFPPSNLTSPTQPEFGFGCMGFSAFYSTAKETTIESAREVIHRALELGVRVLNTATFYGELNEAGYGENLRLLRQCLEGVPRENYELMVKVGMDTRCPVEKTGTYFEMKGDEESLRQDVEYALKELNTDYIDIAVLCRVPKNIEESIQTLLKLKEEKKIKHIGLSEASYNTLEKVRKLTEIYCIEQEYSLFSRDIEENDYINKLRNDLNIKRFFLYSPLGKGFFCNLFKNYDDLKLYNDFRLNFVPKLSSKENFDYYLSKFNIVKEMAEKKQITTGQLCLLWLIYQGRKEKKSEGENKQDVIEYEYDMIPIPGTTKINHLEENMKVLEIYQQNNNILTSEDLKLLDETFKVDELVGERYAHPEQTFKYN